MAGIGKKKNTTRGGRRGGKKPTRGRPSPIKKTNDMKLENRDEEEAEVLSESSEEGGSHPIDEYLEYVKQLEKKHGYILEEQLSPRAEPDTKTATGTTTSDSKAVIQKPLGVSEHLSLPPPRESLDAVPEQPPDGVILIEDDAEMLTSAEYRQFSRPVRYFDEDASVGSTCFKCGLVGHFARDCPNPAKQRPCFLCATFGHSSIKCPNTPCFRCGESGHMARDCLVKLDGWESSNRFICRRCGTNHCRASGPGDVLRAEGHCNQRYSDDDLRMVTCMSCGHVGHANCKGLASTDAIPSCYNCGDKGHIGFECKDTTPGILQMMKIARTCRNTMPAARLQHHFTRKTPHVTGRFSSKRMNYCQSIQKEEGAIENMSAFLDSLKWDSQGLAVAIAQHVDTGEVLMQAFVDRNAVNETLQTGLATFYSRSRKGRWCKGETSGHFIKVQNVYLDCDKDSIIYLSEPIGPACHTNAPTCYFTKVSVEEDEHGTSSVQVHGTHTSAEFSPMTTLYALERTIQERKENASTEKPSWTVKLLNNPELCCKKVREEAGELCQTWEESEGKERAASEAADLFYHAMVLLNVQGVSLEDVSAELRRRFGTSGIEEKASRT